MESSHITLLGMTPEELLQVTTALDLPPRTARQIARWLYVKHVATLDEMTDLSLAARQRLSERYTVGASAPVEAQRSTDGTVKYLFRTSAGDFVESVYIPDGSRATLCVSSQVGCKMRCAFCMTGRQGFAASLSATDILNQIYSLPERDSLTNVVFMGQGEPFDNTDNVLRSLRVLTEDWGYAWSPKRITVSTVGLMRGLRRFLDESRCHLAVSLHNPFPAVREALMPAVRPYPITDVDARQPEVGTPSAPPLVRIYRIRRSQRQSPSCRSRRAPAARLRLPRQPHPFSRHPRHSASRSRRGHHVALSRLSDSPRNFCNHPGFARTGHLCGLRPPLHGPPAGGPPVGAADTLI